MKKKLGKKSLSCLAQREGNPSAILPSFFLSLTLIARTKEGKKPFPSFLSKPCIEK